jgi:hypothetical protein
MLKRVLQLFKIINDSHTELEEIRKKCKHKKFHVALWDYGPGRYHDARVCDDCGDNLGMPQQTATSFEMPKTIMCSGTVSVPPDGYTLSFGPLE